VSTSYRSTPQKAALPSPGPTPSKAALSGPSVTESVQCDRQEACSQDSKSSTDSLAPPGGRTRASNARVKKVKALIKEISKDEYQGRRLLIERTLPYADYKQLCQQIEESEDEELRGHFNDRLR
jgi:hypothetical protein